MTTQSRIEANRANARQSTGPRTEAGNAKSSRNAVTHDLFTATFAVAEADRCEFDSFLELQRQELDPQGVNEEIVFANLVQAAWKTETVRRLECQALAEQNEAKLDRLGRYAARFERAYYRALAELRKLQTERAIREASAPAEDTAPLADVAKVKKQTQPPADPDGLESYVRRLEAESRWTSAQLRAIRQGVEPFPMARQMPHSAPSAGL